MKHTKKLLALAAAFVMVFSLAVVLMIGTGAENATPSLSVNYANLSFGNNISVVYAVSAKNTDNVELLIWDAPQAEYTVGTQSYTVSTTGVQDINGEPHYIFFMNHLGANQMTDSLYAVAHSVVDEIDYYSPVAKYSIIEYAYDILGMDGTPSTNENLKTLVKEMLEYGAAAQILTGYKTESLATGDYVLVKTTNGTLADGFKSTVVAEGTSIDLTAPATLDGKTFHSWVDTNGNVVSYDTNVNVTASKETYTATYYALKDSGYVYELNSIRPYNESQAGSMTVDGVMEDLYKEGVHLTSYFNHPTGNNPTTFDVYFVADAKNIYFYYYFNKQEEIFFKEEYASRHHEDCVDFCLNLAGTAALGTEFHILGGVEGAEGTAATSVNTPELAGVTDYYVKHYENSNDYSVEFAIPINKITGTDASGNKMLSFTALSTITTSWPEGQAAPNRSYTVSYKYTRNEGKATPSYIVINDTYERPEDSAHTVAADGNYVYTLTKYAAGNIAVDGLRDDAYNSGVHQSDVYGLNGGGSGYTVYYTADAGYIYVLYEFTKKDPIIYFDGYGGNHYKLDCADFCLDLTGAGTELGGSHEFRILAGVEGNIDQVATDVGKAGLTARGISACYVKHTYNGYNVEFAIPLSKVTGTDANGNKMITFTACSTIARFLNFDAETGEMLNDTGRSNPTTDNASGKGGGDAKKTPNYLVIKKAFELEETTDTLTVNGEKDAAYNNGIKFDSKYQMDEDNRFTVSFAATKEKVYVFYEVKDSRIVHENVAPNTHWNDCADFILSLGAKDTEGTSADFRIFAGTGDNSGNVSSKKIESYYVKHTNDGYNVEFCFNRSDLTSPDAFSFLAMTTNASTPNAGAIYSCIETEVNTYGNTAKGCLNKVTIVPAK